MERTDGRLLPQLFAQERDRQGPRLLRRRERRRRLILPAQETVTGALEDVRLVRLAGRFMPESVAGIVALLRASLPPYSPSTGAVIAAICSAVGGDP